ncbi:MAG: T9SS type A sorting domain-containing protein, partial [Bacteroidales bacterium]|nr:T9SS type A sorting domain-containing protein [Bacteroidales bacterium]
TNYDGHYDALCLFAQQNQVPNLFTLGDNELRISTNALPLDEIGNTHLPLGIRLFQNGNQTITFDGFESFDGIKILLEDTYENTIVDLRNEHSYTFYHNSGIVTDRFVIHFIQNNAPVVVYQLDDINALEDEELFTILPEYYFEDNDLFDSLMFSVTFADDEELPDWIYFDNNEMSFIINPANENVGEYHLKFTATDNFNETAEILFNLNVINVNDAPVLENKLPDDEANAYENWSYLIPENAFYDVDLGDILTYSAELVNGIELPIWMIFDPVERTFKGNPTNTDAGKYKIAVKCTDLSGAFVTDEFNLKINKVTGIDENNVSIEVYPNPSSGMFVINSYIAEYDYEITDITGKVVLKSTSVSNQTSIDLSSCASGTYTIRVDFKDKKSITKLISIE